MSNLKFNVKLKETPVTIVDENNEEKIYKLKELTGEGRAKYNDNFDYKIEIVDGEAKATAGDNFKVMSSFEFLAMCLYDENDKLVPVGTIKKYPATMTDALQLEGLKISGMDKESLEAAKNESAENADSGSE
jgi:hypothetical protein